jgi:hypothetical protein
MTHKKGVENGKAGRSRLSLHPLTPEQAITGMFKIKPADVQRITGKPAKAKKK